jgi:hypothetical protein
MVFLAPAVKGDEGGRPLDVEVRGQGLGIVRHLQGNKLGLNKVNHTLIRVRDRTHLPAADSPGVKKVQEDWLPR